MSSVKSPKNRGYLNWIIIFGRALLIIGLVILVISLFFPEIGEASLTKQVFGSPNPPGQSKSPPGQSHSPPGPFISPPGQSHSPPGPFISPPGRPHSPPGPSISPPGLCKSKQPHNPSVCVEWVGTGRRRLVKLTCVDENSLLKSPE